MERSSHAVSNTTRRLAIAKLAGCAFGQIASMFPIGGCYVMTNAGCEGTTYADVSGEIAINWPAKKRNSAWARLVDSIMQLARSNFYLLRSRALVHYKIKFLAIRFS
jgi:hydroxyethylthiazole kinase-like sugar kinase family protein